MYMYCTVRVNVMYLFIYFFGPDLELPPGGETKKTRTPSKSEPDTPTPTLPLTTPDYAAGLGVEYPPSTPVTPGGPGGSELGGPGRQKGALELALQSPGPSTSSVETQLQRPQVHVHVQ